MLIYLFLMLALFCSNKQYSPNIINLFEALPSKYVDDLSLKERRFLIQNNEWLINNRQYNVEFDLNEGMLKMEQLYANTQTVYTKWQLRTWQLKDKILLCLSIISVTNEDFRQSDFKFFEYNNQMLLEVPEGYLKFYTNDFDKFMLALTKQFCDFSTEKKVIDKIKNTALIFDLFDYKEGILLTFIDEKSLKTYPRLRLNYKSKSYEFNNGIFE